MILIRINDYNINTIFYTDHYYEVIVDPYAEEDDMEQQHDKHKC